MDPLVRFPDVLQHAPLGRLLGVAGHLMGQRWGRHLAEHHGLTTAGMRVLMILHRAEGDSTHREVAERCFVRPATLTGIVDTLERDGFVERRRDPNDRRSIQLTLTDKGREHSQALIDRIHTDAPLTSVDADPAKKAVIREFLIELITNMSDGDVGQLNPDQETTDETTRGLRPC
ncbi:MarR family transcriptional regulator [Micromonospora sp. PPF5-17]|uniref:MarR family transcriptional regulator n=1 Tax=Micromonospora solifontis TaxID=2487138 RepID=A0ABX9WLN7_9ACTN|nr:MarR family transcriptional regulator [Micromonospora sp. PPF5-17B]NES35021.1 MarR family transcriptional regulator [Micromonospora solifontis]NES57478.1 MarR family transcriptional regulator [Micromonospora sp. PPF5-6]RNM01382.1 MarR family transcriptional regulator [Micromonospora solifontis]